MSSSSHPPSSTRWGTLRPPAHPPAHAASSTWLRADLLRFRTKIYLGALAVLELLVAVVPMLQGLLGSGSAQQVWRHWDHVLLAGLLALGVLLARAAVEPKVHRRIDVAATTLVALVHASTLLQTSQGPKAWHGIEFALVVLLFVRAALLPSRPARSAWVGLLALAPLLLVALLFELGLSAWFAAPPPGFVPFMQLVALGVVWICTLGLSAVLHGWQSARRSGDQLGPYTLLSKLGEGGMGAVFLARHAMLDRPVALKVLRPDRSDEVSLAWFEQEVRHTAALSHRNTVTIFDYGRTPAGAFYYVMEYLDGVDLARLVGRTGPLPAERVVSILAQVCASLAEAHDQGLVHRDIKPANVVLCQQGGEHDVVKVVDFGLASGSDERSGLDEAGNVLAGTPQYMAPEAILAPDKVDTRSDLYSVGALGYFLLVGAPVVDTESVHGAFRMHLFDRPLPPSQRTRNWVPHELDELIMSLLSKAPDGRPASARELGSRLLRLVSPSRRWTAADGARWWAEHGQRVREHYGATTENKSTMSTRVSSCAPGELAQERRSVEPIPPSEPLPLGSQWISG